MGGSGVVVRYEIAAPGIPLNVVNVHLETVRDGLAEAVRARRTAGSSSTTRTRAMRAIVARRSKRL